MAVKGPLGATGALLRDFNTQDRPEYQKRRKYPLAYADYRLCDLCGHKTFYDSNLNYEYELTKDEFEAGVVKIAGNILSEYGNYRLDYLGDWSVICLDCSKTHRTLIVPIN